MLKIFSILLIIVVLGKITLAQEDTIKLNAGYKVVSIGHSENKMVNVYDKLWKLKKTFFGTVLGNGGFVTGYLIEYTSKSKKTIQILIDGEINGKIVTDKYGNYSEIYSNLGFDVFGPVYNGSYVRYHKENVVSEIGLYENGNKVGKWVYFHPNGQLRGIGTYLDSVHIILRTSGVGINDKFITLVEREEENKFDTLQVEAYSKEFFIDLQNQGLGNVYPVKKYLKDDDWKCWDSLGVPKLCIGIN